MPLAIHLNKHLTSFIRVVIFKLAFSLFVILPVSATAGLDVRAPSNDKSADKMTASLSNLSGLKGAIPQNFNATYKMYYKWMKMGEGRYEFQQRKIPSGIQYQFSLSSKMRFLFFSDKRKISSDFTINKGLIFPIVYQHTREGSGADYSEQVDFDWNKRTVDARFHKKSYQLDLNSPKQPIEGQAALNSYTTVLDGIAVQFQLFLDVRKNPEKISHLYPIIEPYGLMERSFEFVGRESVELEVNGDDVILDCVVYEVKREQKKFKTLMYFAKELGYLPVQLIHYSNDKKQFSAMLSEFNAPQ